MFDRGELAGRVAQAHAPLADVAASIGSTPPEIAAQEALCEALTLAGQLDLAVVLLTERVDRWLVLLCRHHHSEEHKGGLHIKALGKGKLAFTVVKLKTGVSA